MAKFTIVHMTNIRHFYIHILIAIFFASFFSVSWAQDDSKKKKTTNVEFVVPEVMPDPVAPQARPDRHPGQRNMPMLAARVASEQLHGIDVSHYQGRINWDEVAKDPNVSYVYLKATEGVNTSDDTYRYNFRECKRVGLKVGSYLFFRPRLSAKAQFQHFMSMVDTKSQDLLPVIDAEVIKGVSVRAFQTRLLELCQLFEKEYGKKPIIYTGRNFYNKYIHGNSRLQTYKYFIASYTFEEPQLNGGKEYVMWQYTATGNVKGIRGDVDQSKLMGHHTLADILY